MLNEESQRALAEYAMKYPALITFEQAAEIAQIPMGTVYDWSHRGLFDGFKIACGRERRLLRDRFVTHLLDPRSAHLPAA